MSAAPTGSSSTTASGGSWRWKIILSGVIAGLFAYWAMDADLRIGIVGWGTVATFLIALFCMSGVIGWVMKHPFWTLIILLGPLYGVYYIWRTGQLGQVPFGDWTSPDALGPVAAGAPIDPLNLILIAGAIVLFGYIFYTFGIKPDMERRAAAKNKKKNDHH